jgi:hypothetical protein
MSSSVSTRRSDPTMITFTGEIVEPHYTFGPEKLIFTRSTDSPDRPMPTGRHPGRGANGPGGQSGVIA